MGDQHEVQLQQQMFTRKCTWNTTAGAIDLMTMGDISSPTSQTALPTGQSRKTGKKMNQDIAASVMYSHLQSVSRIKALDKKTDVDAGLVERGSTFQYYLENGLPGRKVYVAEAYVHNLVFPGTDLASDGAPAMLGFSINVFGVEDQKK